MVVAAPQISPSLMRNGFDISGRLVATFGNCPRLRSLSYSSMLLLSRRCPRRGVGLPTMDGLIGVPRKGENIQCTMMIATRDCRWRDRLLSDHGKLLRLRDAAKSLGISYSTLKRWIHTRKLRTVKTQGGHHRVPESELHRHLHFAEKRMPPSQRRTQFRRISARNQLIGRIVDIKVEGIMAQVTLSIAGQQITSIITSEAVREMRLEKGQPAAALIKSTEVMILRA
jgi:molybdopterin-binding protein